MASTTTQFPVVLIHGVFGYGKTRPLWNSWSPYWPETALRTLNNNHVIVDVGALSSDHDRACEAFYQLYGGRVDYGEQHSHDAGHNRYGAIFEEAAHPDWSASNPVHLVGHSFGATTALELYQLLCKDFFGVGSDHRWVVSLVSIAGPLTGTTLTHLFGLHEMRMVPYSLGHFIGAALGVWFKLHSDWPVLRRFFDFRMPQWECVTSFRELLSAHGRINSSMDLAVFDIIPHERMRRNARLRHMDKLFLVSVATSNHVEIPKTELGHSVMCAGLALGTAVAFFSGFLALATAMTMATLLMLHGLRRRVGALDYAVIPSLYALLLIMRRHVRGLHMIFDGKNLRYLVGLLASEDNLDSDDSTFEEHEGEINPMNPVNASKLRRGKWYVHRVRKNHMAGTHFDSDSPALFRRLFELMSGHFEAAETLHTAAGA
ncbi:hypothetical protein BBJ28_00024291 [Nothophytophthora sp. Chile5]|nr:hypothetical protein BBJ28_00024291 [Nothophytophthora sp. Chile5]